MLCILNSSPVALPKELFYKPTLARQEQKLLYPTKGNSFKKRARETMFRKASELLDRAYVLKEEMITAVKERRVTQVVPQMNRLAALLRGS